jgi:apolipoprotein D and lipocalin family protein
MIDRMHCMHRLLLSLAVALAAGTAAAAEPAAPPATIDRLDVPRYMGTWHEIAKLPNRFQRDCVAATRAEYALLPSGRVSVTNSCQQADGSRKQAAGEARQIGAADSPKLQVRFAPAWLSFLPFVWGDYWVLDLDPAYSLAAVGDPTREYLWILSRTPQVEPAALQALLARVARQGYPVERLERTPQPAR